FVVINIVRDNPSFFVAYFLFTQEFILNQIISGAGEISCTLPCKSLELVCIAKKGGLSHE
ncbi:hypothetical protein, partial [Lactobacillus delbrueckii]|uniref:hypothetical protein n=1 Tax=Lactobacillus delbrueckii TaxID=1584 RepID=UPI0021825711